ncbi:Major facilitator superfamily (MFS) transporter [Lunatimonas lonarensis]|uniref:Major facilitator superfamily (MFS) transporter n=2 Tax=Lunatimonas lonarensis TaxID=1232681 RepID=R7ZM35_9BACT|nr:Major facilitator superfamily (MFS) transporter [Lunatimonas lonarensis]
MTDVTVRSNIHSYLWNRMNNRQQSVQLGLKENWKQFTVLVIVNAFVGAMIGMERTIFPQFAEITFGVASKTAILSFITAFGLTKAFANYYTGRLANRIGRKNLLVIGWLIALPVPLLLIYAPSWNWVIFANMLLGLSQGLTWSSTVVMKIDLVGEKNRGLAMGLNEFAGYLAVGLMALLTGVVAENYGITPYPFYLGLAVAAIGLLLSLFWVRDTRTHVHSESNASNGPYLKQVFWETTLKNKALSSVTQAGLINNLNDGMIWGLLPILLLSAGFNHERAGIITAIYPTVWGMGQLVTGKMADHFDKKRMLFWGMLIQGLAIVALPFQLDFYLLALIAALLGLGTAMVYPTFLTTIAQLTNPVQRAESIGTFRLWRDLGYAFGAILSGLTADAFGLTAAILLIGILTIASSLIIQFRMPRV